MDTEDTAYEANSVDEAPIVEQEPSDTLDEDENRPLPAVAPAALLEGLSQLWSYPWKGLDTSRAVLADMVADEDLTEWRDGLVTLQASLDAYDHSEEKIVGADAYQLEYTRLFIGSFRMYAPPYASYYVDGDEQVYGPTTVEIEDLYAQFGIELGENEHDMPDHLRFLLAFLAMLSKSYELKGAVDFAYAYEDFEADYIAPWVHKLAGNIEEYAEFPFFKNLIAFTLNVLDRAED